MRIKFYINTEYSLLQFEKNYGNSYIIIINQLKTKKMNQYKRLENILDSYAVESVKKLSKEEVVKNLNSQGIKSLEDLVQAKLDDFIKGGIVARTTFIYEQFVYKESRVIDESLVDIIEAHVKSLKR